MVKMALTPPIQDNLAFKAPARCWLTRKVVWYRAGALNINNLA